MRWLEAIYKNVEVQEAVLKAMIQISHTLSSALLDTLQELEKKGKKK